jgi:hypothetical protein
VRLLCLSFPSFSVTIRRVNHSYNTLNTTSMTQFVNWAGILPTGEIYVVSGENELSSCTFNNTGSSMSFTVTARF